MEETTFVPNHERRRRRGLLVFALIGSTVAMIGAGAMSLALFTDTAATSGSFTTGTIDINTSTATLFTVGNMMPGDTQTATLTVSNGGTAQLRYAMTSATTGSAVLAGQLTLAIRPGTCPSVAATIYSATLGAAAFGNPAPLAQAGDRTLNAGASEDLCFSVSLPSASTSTYAGLTATQTFTFSAEQTANNP